MVVAGVETVRGTVRVHDGVSGAGGLSVSAGGVHVARNVIFHGGARAGELASLAGGMTVAHHGLQVGHELRVEGLSDVLGGGVGLAVSGGLTASQGTSTLSHHNFFQHFFSFF